MQHLPKGIDISVPDLSQFKKTNLPDPIAIKVNPGDKVMVLLPRNASQQEVSQITDYLVKWAPETVFLVLAGPESITVIPAPSQDSEPQGQLTARRVDTPYEPVVSQEFFDEVTALGPDETCYCEGQANLHRRGTGELCSGAQGDVDLVDRD